MDVRKWLERTEDRALSDPNNDPKIPDFLQPLQDKRARHGREYRRKRKRASSDSSLIIPVRTHAQPKASRRHKSAGAQYDDASPSSRSNERSESSRRNGKEVKADPYERRPRHKTKADHYEPKTKKHRNDDEPVRQRKRTRKRRNTHRAGDGERTTGLVQSFQLKNGRKDSRLTLQTDTTAGLFRHGRAAVQMAGRRNGLPDLAFNEMKFLQNPTEHQDEPAQGDPPTRTNKNDPKRAQDEEISTYFQANKVTTADRQHSKSRPYEETTAAPQTVARRRSIENRHQTPPVDLPEKPFLGFGSKGPQAGRRQSQSESTQYLSWSDSNPNHRAAEQHRPRPVVRQEVIREAPFQIPPVVGRKPESPSEPRPRDEQATDANAGAKGRWKQTGRARGLAQIEVYQPPETAVREERQEHFHQSTSKTTAQSLPRNSSPYRRLRPIEPTEAAHDSNLPGDYHTSDILDIRELRRRSLQAAEYRPSGTRSRDQDAKDNFYPDFSVDQLLGQARDAVTKRNLSNYPRAFDHPLHVRDEVSQEILRDYAHLAHSNRNCNSYLEQPVLELWHGPKAASRLEFRPPDLAVYRRESSVARRPLPQHSPVPSPQQVAQLYADEDYMLDDGRTIDDEGFSPNPDGLTQRMDEIADLDLTTLETGLFEGQKEGPYGQDQTSRTTWSSARERLSVRPGSTHRRSTRPDLVSERSVEAQHDAVDGFAGFWKPNVLY